jgi:membrane peptidoglycan carboxypeptidase
MAEGLRKATKEERRARKGSFLRRALIYLFWAGLTLGVLGVIALVVMYQRTEIPDPNREFQAETTTVYYSDGKHKIGTFALQNRDAVALSDVPQHVQDAVVAAENRSFWTDPGIDVKGIARAALSNVSSESTQGASTITQQYVKVLYLSTERTYSRKIKEAILALKIERELSKQEILQGYLNTIYFGRGAYGIEAASHAYFGIPSAKLKPAQAAVLASVLNAPSSFDPAVDRSNAARLLQRYQYVLSGMADMGTIEADQAEKLSQRLPKLTSSDATDRLGGQRGFLLSVVEHQLREKKFSEDEIYGGGLRIVTTFDWKDQQAAVSAVREERPTADAKGVHVAVTSVEPGTGALRAMFGGPDYIRDQRNWALTGRQPGSSFKPFTLAAGFEQGHKLTDILDGNAIEVPDADGTHTVRNEFDANLGPITLERATEVSSNTAFVDLSMQLDNTSEDVIDSAVRAGVPKDAPGLDRNAITSTLGTADVAPVDMANSYATFAAQGEHHDWYVVEKVSDDNGDVRYEHERKPERAYSRNVANSVNYALQEVVRDGTGRAALELDRPVAGKTGTAAQSDGDVISAWFVGYTPQLSTAVMYVRGDDGQGVLDGVAGQDPFIGGGYPARTWTAAMQDELDGEPVKSFIEPEDDKLIESPSPTATPTATPTEEPSPTETKTRGPKPKPTQTWSPTETKTPGPPRPTATPTAPETSVCDGPPGHCKHGGGG